MTTAAPSSTIDSCTELVTRIEQRIHEESADHAATFVAIPRDFVQTIPVVCGVTLTCIDRETANFTTEFGSEKANSAAIEWNHPITAHSSVRIEVWFDCNVPSGGPMRVQAAPPVGEEHCIRETAAVVVRLAAEALLRHRTAFAEQLDDDIEKLQCDSQELDAVQQAHRCAELVARRTSFDRVSVLRRVGQGYRFFASSVQANVDRNASRVSLLEQAAIWLNGRCADRIEARIQRNDTERPPGYFEDNEASSFTARWLFGRELLLLGESDADQHSSTLQEPTTTHWKAVEGLLARAMTPKTALTRIRNFARRLAVQIALAAMVLAILCLLPMTIRVPAQGRLTPVHQESVYSPAEGVITSVQFKPGEVVRAGDTLLELASHEWALREAEVLGALMSAQEQLAVTIARRGEQSGASSHLDRRVTEVRIKHLKQQLEILRQRRSELTIRSPIDGVVTVVLDDASESLSSGRPVQFGQPLVRIFQPEGGYEIQLEIDDRDAGYVVRAESKSDQPLRCQYRRQSDPTTTRRATVTRLSDAIRVNEAGRSTLRATLQPDRQPSDGVPESGVVGWIESETAPAIYVLFRKVVQTLRTKGLM